MKNSKDIHIQLVKRCKNGDTKAQYSLYKLYSKAMYNTALRLVKNKMDAEDIIQESFVTAFTKIKTFKEESTFGAWIKRIVINNCISMIRKNKNHFTELEIIDEKLVNEEIEETVEPEWINCAIKDLPDGARSIFCLYVLEGYKHKEIAKTLQISESTSKSQYIRAKNLLPDLIRKYANDKSFIESD